MLFKSKISIGNAINVPDNFAKVIYVDDETIDIQVLARINTSAALKTTSLNYVVQVRTQNVAPIDINVLPSKNISAELVKNKLGVSSIISNQASQVLASVVGSTTTNVMKNVADTALFPISQGKSVVQKKTSVTTTTLKDLKLSNGASVASFSTDLNEEQSTGIFTIQKSYMQALSDGLDPAQLSIDAQKLPLTAGSAFSGVGKTITMQNIPTSAKKIVSNLLKSNKIQTVTTTTDDTTVASIKSQVVDNDLFSTVLSLDRSKLKNNELEINNVFVDFMLMNTSNNTKAFTLTKQLNIAQLLEAFDTPMVSPSVSFATSKCSTKVKLKISNFDDRTSKLNIYVKFIKPTTIFPEDYKLVSVVPATSKIVEIGVDRNVNAVTMYRVIPVGKNGTLSHEYTNVVVQSDKKFRQKRISLTAKVSDSGMSITASKLPVDCISLLFIRKDVTLRESHHSHVGTPVFISEKLRQSDTVSISDTEVKDGHIYQYACKVTYIDGLTVQLGNVVIEKQSKKNDFSSSTTVTNVNKTTGSKPNVKFELTTTVNPSTLQKVWSLIKNEGDNVLYTQDVSTDKEKLQPIIEHHVQRLNLTTGVIDDFGVISQTSFDDDLLSTAKGIEKLKKGETYKYIVRPCIMQKEVLLENASISVKDKLSNKTYNVKPSKSFHPHNIKTGTIFSTVGLRTKVGKDDLAYGKSGSSVEVDASFDDTKASVIDVRALFIDLNTVKLSFSVLGNIDLIDHFIIMKLQNGIRTTIGKCHSEFATTTVNFYHSVTVNDKGSIQYIVQPFYHDYSVASESSSNVMVVS